MVALFVVEREERHGDAEDVVPVFGWEKEGEASWLCYTEGVRFRGRRGGGGEKKEPFFGLEL